MEFIFKCPECNNKYTIIYTANSIKNSRCEICKIELIRDYQAEGKDVIIPVHMRAV